MLCLVVQLFKERDVRSSMAEDDQGLTDEDIERLHQILEKNREVGANEFTMGSDDDRDDDD